jgi:hypothetical protein
MPAYNQSTITIYQLPDFEKLTESTPWVFDGMTLAHHLGIRHRTLFTAIKRREKEYTRFFIQKKSGSARPIHAPSARLKFIQKRILLRFFTHIVYPEHIAAYVPERTPRDSAEKHSGKAVLLIIDLKDFFTNTRRAWVRHMLQDEFHLPFPVANLLADLVTVPVDTVKGRRHVVPQGAPTSGAICNWVAYHRFDREILKLCEKYGYTYTRYADDLAFSRTADVSKRSVNAFTHDVYKIIQKSGYAINRKKTRVGRPGRQQRLLGMTVNEKPNVMRRDFRAIRARLNHCKYKGYDQVATEMGLASGYALKAKILGTISHFHMINPEKARQLKNKLQEVDAHHAAILHAVQRDPVDLTAVETREE